MWVVEGCGHPRKSRDQEGLSQDICALIVRSQTVNGERSARALRPNGSLAHGQATLTYTRGRWIECVLSQTPNS
jgi:hypothetical protein